MHDNSRLFHDFCPGFPPKRALPLQPKVSARSSARPTFLIHCGKFSPKYQVKTVGLLETFQRFQSPKETKVLSSSTKGPRARGREAATARVDEAPAESL